MTGSLGQGRIWKRSIWNLQVGPALPEPIQTTGLMKPRRPRSRYGCNTCKIRRVKCDERLPQCLRCLDTGRRCDGPPTEKITIHHYARRPSFSTVGTSALTTRRIYTNPFDDPYETRTFDFYLRHAAPSLGGCLDGDLWRTIVPQLCHSSRVIRHAVLAISALYEHPLHDSYSRHGIRYNAHQRRALAWYRASISQVIAIDPSQDEQGQLELSLLTCLLFASVEIQHGIVHSTLDLLRQSYNLIHRYLDLPSRTDSTRAAWVMDIVCPFLARQAVLFTVFGHNLPPEFYTIINRSLPSELGPVTSLAAARTALYAILLQTFDLVQTAYLSDPSDTVIHTQIMDRQSSLLTHLLRWQAELDYTASITLWSATETALYHTLTCNQKVANVWLGSLPQSPTSDAATQPSTYAAILRHAEDAISCLATEGTQSVPFMFELGITPSLFFVGWQCRSARVGRQVIALMKQAPAQESLFVTALQINALEKIIAIEEGQISKVEECKAAEEARLPFVFHAPSAQHVVSKCALLISILLPWLRPYS